ncbi:class I SAM-dependent methyltransferase [Beijerinckia indica]|uniref:Ribosomal RNA adenine methylase transferase n=1 Tax=Beijerinckia indica subsp. indica (strain ATCC 9039 / DSM 1715 / NCIMB 8712) TaxID=395963 RepID=B2IBR6_BEII9|nr:methyltransferase domain-containing protein [Beijerinckia indica]ACB93788.1 ribosomal RNA adenine methylase transferase [Beijerinckia indica subsp. indica ATCC 9039]
MPALKLEQRLADEARFFKSWLDNPLLTGAVSPSSRSLARMMARYVDLGVPGPIIELGPGTGPITEALLQHGVAPERLILIEYDSAFCQLLKQRFSGVRVVQGDAYRLRQSLGPILEQPAACIVSSLPLLNKPEQQRLALLEDAFSCMGPEGSFIQFTYGLISPVPRNLVSGRFEAKPSPPVWFNLPPARVWVYRRCVETVQRPAKFHDLLGKLKLGTDKIQREVDAAKARLHFGDKAKAVPLKRSMEPLRGQRTDGSRERGRRS